MYDTVVLKSPEIDLETKDKILNFCNRYEGIDFATGEILYSFTRGELEGSYDYRIRICVDNMEYVKEDTLTPVKVRTYWHVKVECSLHKLMMNHNCFGGPCDIQRSIAYLVKFLEEVMDVKFPVYHWWEVYQVDVARIFRFQDKQICKKIIENLKNSYYSRRKPMVFDTSVMFSGSTTTNKFYWKGPEFEKHDYKRINKYIRREVDLSYSEDNGDRKRSSLVMLKMKYDKILERAMRIIRFECSVKFRKLKELFDSEKVFVYMLHDKTLENCMNEELRKIIKEDDSMDIVRRSDLVLERLKSLFDTRLANSLYSVWCQIVQFGEEKTRKEMSKATFYKYRKLLIESGVSWTCSTVNLKLFSIVPADFSFLNNNYVLDEVDQEVLKKLSEVA